MIHSLSTYPAREAFQIPLLQSGYVVCLLHNLSAGKSPPHTHTLLNLHRPEVACLLESMYLLEYFTVNYGEGIRPALDLHAF